MSTTVRYMWTVMGIRPSTDATMDHGAMRYVRETDFDKLKAECDVWEKRARDYGWPDCGELAEMTDERDALLHALKGMLMLDPAGQRANWPEHIAAFAAIDAARSKT